MSRTSRARSRNRAHALRGRGKTRALGLERLEVRTLLTTDVWIGTASGSWTDPTRWSLGAVPTPADAVVIDVSGASPTVTLSSGNQSVLSLTASDPLSITGGSLTVGATSTISGGLSMTGGSLEANGAGVALTVTGPTTVSGSSLYAVGGATLSLPAVT